MADKCVNTVDILQCDIDRMKVDFNTLLIKYDNMSKFVDKLMIRYIKMKKTLTYLEDKILTNNTI